jgi:hypothetical protein
MELSQNHVVVGFGIGGVELLGSVIVCLVEIII